jgi:uncharacterized membrane-anchored protein YhcB (DUF1043 family)
MNEIILLIIGLGVGAAAGFWFAQQRAKADAAKAVDVQKRFDDYRLQVTSHFGRTAEHFQAIGQQYKELYEHMASGADTLFDVDAVGARLEGAARMAVADTVDVGADGGDARRDAPEVVGSAGPTTIISSSIEPVADSERTEIPVDASTGGAETAAADTSEAVPAVEEGSEDAANDEGRTYH